MNLEEARRLTIQKQTGTELDIAPKVGGGWNRGTLQAGYKEDADSWLRNWRTERGLPPDSGVLPSNRDEVPPYLRGWIFPKADASQQNGMMMIAHGEYFDDEGEPIENAPYIFNRNTTELEVPWLKEDYYKDLPRRKELHDKNYHT